MNLTELLTDLMIHYATLVPSSWHSFPGRRWRVLSWRAASSGAWPSRRKTWRCSTSPIRRLTTPRSKQDLGGMPLALGASAQGNSPQARDAPVLAGRLRRSDRGRRTANQAEDADPIDPEMRLLAANALYRVAQRGPQDRATLLRNLDAAIRAYNEALRAGIERPDVPSTTSSPCGCATRSAPASARC